MLPVALLLAAQAAGTVVDYIGAQREQMWADMGQKVQLAGIQSNIDQVRLEAENESLESLKNLRQNLGSQIATYAARGTAIGAGSALIGFNESISNFNADERVRRINLLGKQNQLRGGAAMTRLQYMSDTSKLWSGFASRSLNRIPTSISTWKQIGKDAIGTPRTS